MERTGQVAPLDIALRSLTDEDVVALLDASLEVELRELGRSPGAVFRETAELGWAVGAVPGVSVYRTRLTDEAADERIAELTRALELFGPVTWWACPSSTPLDLPDRLIAAGYDLEDDEAGMALDLDEVVEDLPRPDGIEIEEIGGDDALDQEAIDAWLDVCRRTYGWTDERYARRRALYLDDERRPLPWRHYLCREGGVPVAISRLLLASGVAMIHGVATVPEARRRGIGTAVTLAALQGARRLGYRIAVLQASSMGQGPYRRLGFRFVAPYARFVRQPAVEREGAAEATVGEAGRSSVEHEEAA